MQRRGFIRNAFLCLPFGSTIASTLLSCDPPPPDDLLPPDQRKKIMVIGAGLAGIYAAHLLLMRGHDVEILEADRQWGGRIRALEGFVDFPVELGAEEVHGQKTAWYNLIRRAGGVFIDVDDEDYYQIDDKLNLSGFFSSDPDVRRAINFIEEAETYDGPDKTVDAFAKERGVSDRVMHLVNARLGNEYGTSIDRISIKGLAEESNFWTAGEKNFALSNRSYKQIIEASFPNVLERIVLQTPVKSIDYTSNSIKVTDAKNVTRTVDKVVVTVPLTILKAGDIEFKPALPADKLNALTKIGMGAGMKIILKFKRRFWAANTGSIYGAGAVPEYWFIANGRNNSTVLTAFVMGAKAESLTVKGSGAITAVLADLDKIYGVGVATGAFEEGRIMDWSKEPYIRGAYSFPIVGNGIDMRKALAKPIGDKIYFAGEATHIAGHSGSAHGALETAIRAAQEINP
jgi:monoamine oxidase